MKIINVLDIEFLSCFSTRPKLNKVDVLAMTFDKLLSGESVDGLTERKRSRTKE